MRQTPSNPSVPNLPDADFGLLSGKRAAYYTLGCKLNFSETSTIGGELEQYGVTPVPKGERADICVINTCSVTAQADKKGRNLIRQVVRAHPTAVVVVTGCYAQLAAPELLAMEGVSLVVGTGRKSEIATHVAAYLTALRDGRKLPREEALLVGSWELLHRFEEGCSRDDRTRHFLKVQDGCNCACSYCTIPKARGRSRNGSIASMVAAARKVVAEGGREIVLTGVNIGDFGRTTKERFEDLVLALDAVEGIERYRISSLEPELISDELIDIVAASRHFMPHWHIPLQSGSDEVLRLMRRKYRRALFADRLERIKRLMPDAFVGLDIIVGMRGETDALFEETRAFLSEMPFTRLHLFTYSERKGTDALSIPHIVTPAKKKIRSQILHRLSMEHLSAFYNSFNGQCRPVLWESSEREGQMSGFTDNYIKLTAPYDASLTNRITPARIGAQLSPDEELCYGEPLSTILS